MDAHAAPAEAFDAGHPALEELTDEQALAELVSGVQSLFRLPVSVYSEAGLLTPAPQPSQFYSWLLGKREFGPRAQGVIDQLQHGELGPAGEGTLRCFTGASFQVALVGHEGRRIGRVVLGPFVESAAARGQPLLGPTLDSPGSELFADLPRVERGSARAIARHVVRTLSALLHAGYRCWLIQRAHVSALHDSARERAEHREQLRLAQRQLGQRDRGRYELLLSACEGLSASAEALRAHIDGWSERGSPPGADAVGLSSLLGALERRLASLQAVSRAVAEEPRRVNCDTLPRHLSAELGPLLAGAGLSLDLDMGLEPTETTLPGSLPSALSAFCRALLEGLSAGSRLCVRVLAEDAGLALLGGESRDVEVQVLVEEVERPPEGQRAGSHPQSLPSTERALLEGVVRGHGGTLEPLAEGLLWGWRLRLPGCSPAGSESAA